MVLRSPNQNPICAHHRQTSKILTICLHIEVPNTLVAELYALIKGADLSTFMGIDNQIIEGGDSLLISNLQQMGTLVVFDYGLNQYSSRLSPHCLNGELALQKITQRGSTLLGEMSLSNLHNFLD